MENPTYLQRPTTQVSQPPIRVGDRVKFADGSGSLACKKDGLENIHPAYEHRSEVAKRGVVVAIECVLPTEQFIGPRDFVNDTIVVTDDNLTIFCYNKFLRKI